MPSLSWQAFLQQFVYDPKNPLLFNNGFFVYFFSVFIVIYYAVRNHFRARAWVLCLFSLYFFYKASGWFVSLVLLSAVVDYAVSNLIYRQRKGMELAGARIARKTLMMRLLLLFSIVFNLGMLCCFKYTDFFLTLSNEGFGTHFNLWHLILPVGISFYTFENLSYTIDVYKGEFVPERKFVNYLLFLSFFPKLVMGPIVRAKDFIPQLHKPYEVSSHDFAKGFYLIFSGLFKKLVISDYLTTNFVNYVFDGPSLHTGLECLMAVYGYAIVIYCDFSGYSDVAIGMAKWLGITIPPNFRSPYQSTTITEFWRRWHISLSSWLRDYLYIPLGGNRNGSVATWLFSGLFFVGLFVGLYRMLHLDLYWSAAATLGGLLLFALPAIIGRSRQGLFTGFNLLVTMLLGGFWHGASWNFIIWGALLGIALAVHKVWMQLTGNTLSRVNNTAVYNGLSLVLTFHFICFCWIFFKSPDFATAGQMIHQIGTDFSPSVWQPFYQHYSAVLGMMLLGYALHFIPDSVPDRVIRILERAPMPAYLAGFLAFVLLYAKFKSAVPVMPIYLQF